MPPIWRIKWGWSLTESLVVSGEDVMDAEMYEEIRTFIFDNYGADEAKIVQATMILCGLGANLKKHLGLTFEVEIVE
jgi:hypothetical protein